MKKTLLLLAFCATAQAQVLDYTGSVMSGTITTQTSSGQVVSPFSGYFTAEVALSPDDEMLSYSATFNGSNGVSIPLVSPVSPYNGFIAVGSGYAWFGPTGYYGQPLGGTPQMAFAVNNSSTWDLAAYVSGGDTFTFNNEHDSFGGGCDANTGTSMLCAISVSNPVSGTWTELATQQSKVMVAPEFDAQSGTAMFLLLAGGLAVVRGRERR